MNFNLVHLLILSVIVLITVFFRFNEVPLYPFGDEVAFSQLAVSLHNAPYTPYSELATGHSTLYFYVILFSFKLFGVTQFALRLPAALFGITAVFLLYFVLRYVLLNHKHGQILSLLGAIIFVTSRWYFNFARYAFEATFLLSLELTSLLFLFVHLRKPSIWSAVLCGLFAGLAFHSYYPGRIFFLLPLVVLFWKNRSAVVPFLVTAILVVSPLVTHLILNPDLRLQEQQYATNPTYSLHEKGSMFFHNVSRNVEMLVTNGDMNGRHNYPGKSALNPIQLGLLVLGLIASFKKLPVFPFSLFFGYFVLAFIPTLFTLPPENPNMLRTVTVLPALIFFMVQGIGFIMERVKHTMLMWTIIILIALSTMYEFRTYFMFQEAVFRDDATKIRLPLQDVVSFPQ